MNRFLKVFPIVLLLILSGFYLWQASVIREKSLLDTLLDVVNDQLARSTFTIYLSVLGIVTIVAIAVFLGRQVYDVDISEELKKQDKPLPPILQVLVPIVLLGVVIVFAFWALKNYGLM